MNILHTNEYVPYQMNYIKLVSEQNILKGLINQKEEMIHFFKNNKYVALRLRVSERTVANWVSLNYIGRESCLDFYKLLVEHGYPKVILGEITSLTKGKMESAK